MRTGVMKSQSDNQTLQMNVAAPEKRNADREMIVPADFNTGKIFHIYKEKYMTLSEMVNIQMEKFSPFNITPTKVVS
jgi:hypothetical protein